MDIKTLWGAHLFVPGNRADFLCKLPVLSVKNIIIDLEYATKLSCKIDARYLTRNSISYIRTFRPDINICVRINISSALQLQEEDIRVVSQGGPDSLRVPAINSAYEIERIDNLLTKFEKENELELGSIKLHPMIETPKGLKNASEIIRASSRVEAIALGGENWAYNCGLNRTKKGRELEYVKCEMVTIAAEHGVFAIDSEFSFLNDEKGLIEDCKNSRTIGFKARDTINPRQLEIINTIYYPSEKEYDWAESLLNNLEEIKIGDKSNYVVNGIIINPLTVYQARIIMKKICEVKANGFN